MDITEKDIESLRRILDYEKTLDEERRKLGFEWMEVSMYPATIHRLLVRGLVKCTYKSSKHTHYRLTDEGVKLAEGGLSAVVATPIHQPADVIDIPEDVFSDIAGYDDTKELVRESLLTEKPVHVLLYGPPSIAKTMFLLDLETAGGEYALWLLGSGASKAGMWDLIAERRPRWLLIDELEKMSLVDMSGLLSLMEKGRIVRTKVGRRLDEKMDGWVVASANRIHRLPTELLSRFATRQLHEYNATEYRKVVMNVLVKREGISEDDASKIAMRLVGKSHDVRDAVRVARVSKRIGVDRAVELLVM